MDHGSSRSLLAAAALTLGGCFSLFPMPGSGGKHGPPAKPEVAGKVFGTGTMTVDAWGVTLGVDPAAVDVTNTTDALIINRGKGGYDPINGDFEFSIKKPNPAACQ